MIVSFFDVVNFFVFTGSSHNDFFFSFLLYYCTDTPCRYYNLLQSSCFVRMLNQPPVIYFFSGNSYGINSPSLSLQHLAAGAHRGVGNGNDGVGQEEVEE